VPPDNEAILKELRQIRLLLEKQANQGAQAARQTPTAPVVVEVSVSGAHVYGRADAPVTIVEFTDYQCPFCRRFAASVFPALMAKYIEKGTVRFVSRDLPLDSHAFARKAAQVARCAARQGRGPQMRMALFANASALSDEAFLTFARDLKLDPGQFQTCVKEGAAQSAIDRDVSDANLVGILGTPTFVVGPTASSFRGTAVVGAQPLESFDVAVERALADSKRRAPSLPARSSHP
jgi:protein-disulfide isomerase